jgi:hypothetical protein
MTTEEKIELLKTICWNCSGSMNVEIFDNGEFVISENKLRPEVNKCTTKADVEKVKY